MKRYISLLMGILGFIPILAQQSEYYYYYNGNRIDLEVDSTHFYVVSEGELQSQSITYVRTLGYNISKQVRSSVYNLVTPLPIRRSKESRAEIFLSTVEIPCGLTTSEWGNFFENVRALDNVQQVLPSFKLNGNKVEISNNFYVKLHSEEDVGELREMANLHNVEIIGQHKHMPLWYILSCSVSSTSNALEVANIFYASKKFAYSEPEMYSGITFHSDDTYFDYQWNLKNTGEVTGYPGIDINVEEAWEITKGNNVMVAIYDNPIYAGHPDLPGNIDSYDIYTGEDVVSNGETLSNHGIYCAGVIAARQDNNTCISGVSPKADIMSIAFNGNISDYNGLEISLGFTEAYDRGADVINCAWSYNGGRCRLIDESITDALTKGRRGNGCVVVFAAGDYRNDATYLDPEKVRYPADCNPRILTVGGITGFGERLLQGYSSQHYVFVSSCYGEELDVVAPATQIYTTSYPRSPGSPVNCYGDFDGTSAACAHVSGVAALILSAHPELTSDQVVSLIEYTARKIRPDIYSYQFDDIHPFGGWNEELGYGLIDAGVAVAIAEKAAKTTFVNDIIIDGTELYIDYDVELENVVIEPESFVEIYKDNRVVFKRNVLIKKGAEFLIYKEPYVE